MPKATLTSSFGYRDPVSGVRTYYGPGENIDIPDGLALTLGLPVSPPEPEAVPVVPVSTPLSADFPGRKYLVAAGIDTVEKVPGLIDHLLGIKGIGPKLAEAIVEALKLNVSDSE